MKKRPKAKKATNQKKQTRNKKKPVEQANFSLVVAGQVKAGKSTFLNALLGEQILPSDVLQSTSAIIEVFYSKEVFVEVTYGDGRLEKVFDDLSTPDVNEAIEYLATISSVQEKFRFLPINQLNHMLLSKFRNNPELLRPENVDEFLKDTRLENIYNIDQRDFLENIKSYLNEYKDLSQIPVKVKFGYPISIANQNIFLVDTPGVNALGGVENATYDYLHNADSLLFIQSLKAVESKTMREFVQETASQITNNNKLFMALTHASFHDSEEIARLIEEARKIYAEIPGDNFYVVDSLTELYVQKLKRLSEDLAHKEINSDKKLKKILAPYIFAAEGKEEYFTLAQQGSGFEKLRTNLTRFLNQNYKKGKK